MYYFHTDPIGESGVLNYLKTAEDLLSDLRGSMESTQDNNFVEGLLSATAYVTHRLTSWIRI